MGLSFFLATLNQELKEGTNEEIAYHEGLLVLVHETPSKTVPGGHCGCKVEMQFVPSNEVLGGHAGRP